MALQVWLPLDGSMENLGLDDINVVNQSISGYSAGKIGQALNTLNSYYYFDVPTLVNATVFSCAFWFKQNDSSSLTTNWRRVIDFMTKADGTTTSGIFRFESSYSSGTTYILSTHSNTAYQICPSNVGNRALVTKSGEWHHVAVTVSGTTITFYVDGKLHHSGAQVDGYLTGRVMIGEIGNQSDGWLNDVRIYDHALSVKEVKELSKGLIAHYPLNDKVGLPNLLQHSRPSSSNLSLVGVNTSYVSFVTEDGRDCYKFGTGNTTPSSMSQTWKDTTRLEAATTYTYSALIKCNKSVNFHFTSLGHFQVYNSASTATDKTHEDVVAQRVYYPSKIVANEWTKINITFTTNSLANSIFRVYPTYNCGSDCVVYICDQKLELGSKTTPWIPNEIDDDYVTLGLYENKVHDCSGYLRDGTVIDASNLFSDEPSAYNPSSYQAYRIPISEALVAGQTYTIQLWNVDVQHTGKSAADLGIDFYLGGGSLRMYWWHASNFTNGHADYLKGSFTVTESQSSHVDGDNLFFNVYNSVGYVAGDMYMHIGRWRIEKGAVATNTEPAGDSPRYSVGTHIESEDVLANTSTGISYFYVPVGLTTPDELTISWWGLHNNSSINSGTQGLFCTTGSETPWNPGTITDYNTTAMHQRDSGIDLKPSDGGSVIRLSAHAIMGEWHFYSAVYDGQKAIFYRDGMKFAEASFNGKKSLASFNNIVFGFSRAGGVFRKNTGSYSDVRIYATALSAEDIKELYEVSASVDQNGNTWAYELEEV